MMSNTVSDTFLSFLSWAMQMGGDRGLAIREKCNVCEVSASLWVLTNPRRNPARLDPGERLENRLQIGCKFVYILRWVLRHAQKGDVFRARLCSCTEVRL